MCSVQWAVGGEQKVVSAPTDRHVPSSCPSTRTSSTHAGACDVTRVSRLPRRSPPPHSSLWPAAPGLIGLDEVDVEALFEDLRKARGGAAGGRASSSRRGASSPKAADKSDGAAGVECVGAVSPAAGAAVNAPAGATGAVRQRAPVHSSAHGAPQQHGAHHGEHALLLHRAPNASLERLDQKVEGLDARMEDLQRQMEGLEQRVMAKLDSLLSAVPSPALATEVRATEVKAVLHQPR